MNSAIRILIVPIVAASLSTAGETPPTAPAADCCKLDLRTGSGVNFGGILFPELNYQTAFGSSTTDPQSLAVGHHDPNRHGITQQNIEFSLGVQIGPHVRVFGYHAAVVDRNDHWFGEFEEHYALISSLPLGMEVKAGRFYTRFGYQNSQHPHDFTFIDQYLASGRLIGEDSATVYGGEISLPVLRKLPAGWDDRLTVSLGAVPDPAEEGEEHEEAESLFEGEGAVWNDWLVTADYTLGFAPAKGRRFEMGVSGAWGNNQFERFTHLYGAHFDYIWRPGGVGDCDSCSGPETGEFFHWRTEALLRHFGAESFEDGAGTRDDFTDFGIYSAVSYGAPSGKFQAHLRAEYVSGVSDAGLPERWRVSPAVTWHPARTLPVHFKLQYNYDHSPSFGDEHSVWAQVSIKWGDCCGHE